MAVPLRPVDPTDTVVTERRGDVDSVTLLSIWLGLLLAVPTDLRLLALGGAGSPAAMWALGLGLFWVWSQVQRRRPLPAVGVHPVRLLTFALVGSVLVSYVFAMLRPLPAVEASQADIGVIRILFLVSVLLTAHDGIGDLDRFRTLVRRLVVGVAALAALGLVQFATGRSWVDAISIPGLAHAQTFSGTTERAGFVRSAGTAMSPLEYGTALVIAFPIALALALKPASNERRKPVWRRWLPVALIGVGLLISGSRSTLLGLAVGVVVLLPFLDRRTLLRVVGALIVSVGAVTVTVPGLLGTMRYLFLNTGNDSSAQSRSGSYTLVGEFVSRSPLFGRGFGTYLPQYRILDNQLLSAAIEIGLVGLGVLVALLVAAMLVAITARRTVRPRPEHDGDRLLGPALAAAVLAGGVMTAFFDSLSFPMAAGLIFFVLGLCGAYRRLLRIDALAVGPARADHGR